MARRREMVLLGAGASFPAGIPTARDLAMELVTGKSNGGMLDDGSEGLRLVNALHGLLLSGQDQTAERPRRGVDVEEILGAILMLAEVGRIPFRRTSGGEIELPDATTCRRLAQEITLCVADCMWVEEDDAQRVEYLRQVLEVPDWQKCLTVATLNFDNTMEVLLHGEGYDLGADDLNSLDPRARRGARIKLLKLHGSVCWEYAKEHPNPFIGCIKPVQRYGLLARQYSPAILIGVGNKPATHGPFLELMWCFWEELRKAKTLSVIGYSFGDDHVNRLLARWLDEDTHSMRVVDPGFPSMDSAFSSWLGTLPPSRVMRIEPTRVELLEQPLYVLARRQSRCLGRNQADIGMNRSNARPGQSEDSIPSGPHGHTPTRLEYLLKSKVLGWSPFGARLDPQELSRFQAELQEAGIEVDDVPERVRQGSAALDRRAGARHDVSLWDFWRACIFHVGTPEEEVLIRVRHSEAIVEKGLGDRGSVHMFSADPWTTQITGCPVCRHDAGLSGACKADWLLRTLTFRAETLDCPHCGFRLFEPAEFAYVQVQVEYDRSSEAEDYFGQEDVLEEEGDAVWEDGWASQ